MTLTCRIRESRRGAGTPGMDILTKGKVFVLTAGRKKGKGGTPGWTYLP